MYNRCIVQDQHLHSTVADATKICVNIVVCIYVYSKLQLSEHFEMCIKNLSMYQWCMWWPFPHTYTRETGFVFMSMKKETKRKCICVELRWRREEEKKKK